LANKRYGREKTRRGEISETRPFENTNGPISSEKLFGNLSFRNRRSELIFFTALPLSSSHFAICTLAPTFVPQESCGRSQPSSFQVESVHSPTWNRHRLFIQNHNAKKQKRQPCANP
jgi:hypothetical protein